MLKLHDLLAPTEVLLVRDEVYEHMVFDTDRVRGKCTTALSAFLAGQSGY